MQGILPENASQTAVHQVEGTAKKVVGKLPDDFKAVLEKDIKQFSFIGPVASIVAFATLVSVLGIVVSCFSCLPVKLFLNAAYVFGVTVTLLYRKAVATCDNKAVEDTIILAAMPTLIFLGAYLLSSLILMIIPGLNFLMFLPVLPTLFAATIATAAYTLALNYSDTLIVKRACQGQTVKNVWTFRQ